MTDLLPPTIDPKPWGGSRNRREQALAARRRRRRLGLACRGACVLPAAGMAAWAGVVLALLHHTGVWDTASRLAVIWGMVGAAAVLASAWVAGEAVTRRAGEAARAEHLAAETARREVDAVYHEMQQRCQGLRGEIGRGLDELQWVVEMVRRGEPPTPGAAVVRPADAGDPFEQVAHDIRRFQIAAQHRVIEAAMMMSVDQQAELSGSLARGADRETARADLRMDVVATLSLRMQSLVHRALLLMSEIQAQVEDPDLLQGLFGVDHLVVLVRRQAENLAVIGGGTSRRLWTSPVSITKTVRSAVQEVEHYSRVKMVRPVEGTLRGDAVADVIHLLAELVENATEFCPADPVWIRVEEVPAGLAIEIEDRGVGFARDAERRRMNELLADPARVSLDDLLRDGRIGLWVVAVLARQHGVAVELKKNIYGGVTAVVVLPDDLVEVAAQHHPAAVRDMPTPAGTAELAAIPAAPQVDGQVVGAASRVSSPGAPTPDGGRQTGGWHALDDHSGMPGVSSAPDVEAHPETPDLDRPTTHSASTGALTPPGAHEHSTTSRTSSMSGTGSADRGHGEQPPPLPQRVRLQNLAPQLREPPPTENGDEDSHQVGIEFTQGLLGGFRNPDSPSVSSSVEASPHKAGPT